MQPIFNQINQSACGTSLNLKTINRVHTAFPVIVIAPATAVVSFYCHCMAQV